MTELGDRVADLERENAELRRQLVEGGAALAEALAQQTATAEVLGVINSSRGDLTPVFDAMLEKAMRLCEAAFGVLLIYDGDAFHAVAECGIPQRFSEFLRQPLRPAVGNSAYRMVNGEAVVQITDLQEDEATRHGDPARMAVIEEGGARTQLMVALRKDIALLGIIVVYRQEVRPFSDKQIALLQNFAEQAVIAMENARLITETREALEQQTATAEVLGVINASPGDLTPVFDAILEKAVRVCKADQGLMYRREGDAYRPVAHVGLSEDYVATVMQRPPRKPGERTLVGMVAAEGRVVHIADIAADAQYERQEAITLGMARTGIGVPLLHNGRTIGVFGLSRRRVDPFTDKQIALLQNFAAQAVIAIENARLITETREALEQQTATAEVLGVINSSPGDLAPVFGAMLEKALRLCGAAFGMMNTYDGERFHHAADHGVPAAYAEYRRKNPMVFSPGTGPARIIAGENVVHNIDLKSEEVYERGDPNRRALVDLGGARSHLAVALSKDGRLLGHIAIYRQEVRPFSDKQIALLQNFAAQAVIAMENARLIRATREALEQQTATAEVLGVINSSPGDLAPVFDAILEKSMRLCETTFGHLMMWDGEHFHRTAFRGMPEALIEEMRQPMKPVPGSFIDQVVQGKDLICHADLQQAEAGSIGPGAASLMRFGARARAMVALRKNERLLGTITVYRTEVRPFTDKQIALLQNFAAQAVIAMENARLINETREALEQQTATAEVLGVINSSPGDLAPVFNTILEKAHTLCGADHGALVGYDGEMLRAIATRGVSRTFDDYLRRGFPLFSGTFPDQLMRGEPVHILDLPAAAAQSPPELARLQRQAAELAGTRTLLMVPLCKGSTLRGYIAAYRTEVRPFTDEQIALLQNFATQAVIAMENARLITETREALEQQTATAEVLGVINSSPGDLGPVFDAVLEKALRLCEAAFGTLWTYDAEYFHPAASRNRPTALADAGEPYKPRRDAALGRIVAGDPIVHIPDAREDEAYRSGNPRRRALVDVGGARSYLTMPLGKGDALLGAISIYRQEVRPFTDKQIGLLQSFSAQAVIAIENARLLGELRQRTEEVAELNRGLEARVAEQVEELGRVGRLKRFLAPQLAELIVSQGDEKILESHRREIVVVFCDLRGYTAFTETAEPEEVLDFLREYHGALGPLVAQFEGTLDQFSGDGIMLFFNDPVPIPDPAERAVNMAVAMREAAGALIQSWRRRGRELGFGAGIAQGYATLGQIGFAERSGYTAIGTVCNLAARLCAEAKDGQILIAQRVAAAVEHTTALEEIGSLTLKGLTQPVVAFNVPVVSSQAAFRVIEGGVPND